MGDVVFDVERSNESLNGAYYFDIDSICRYVLESDTADNSSVDTTDVYAYDDKEKALSLINRQISESKSKKNDSNSAIKYDLIKNFIGFLSESDDENYTFFQSTVFNTMTYNGFIKKQ